MRRVYIARAIGYDSLIALIETRERRKDETMMGYDSWLEAPYVARANEEAAFERWCEDEDVDPSDSGAWERFEDAMESAREDAEIEAWENRRDR